MNRRFFSIGTAAVIGNGWFGNVSAQSSGGFTDSGIAVDLINRYVNEVLGEGKSAILYDIIHPDAASPEVIESIYWSHVEDVETQRVLNVEPSYKLVMVFGDDTSGLGYFTSTVTTGREDSESHFCMAVLVKDDLIDGVRLFAHDGDLLTQP